MPNILPQLGRVGSDYDGTKPLPRRLERVAQVLARDEFTREQIAQAAKVSHMSIWRLQQQPAFRARLRVLRQLAAERAMEDEPLALKGNRVAVAGRMVRTLHEQLEANGYETTLGVSKQGNPITGFDRARVSEARQHLALIADMMEPKQSTIVEATNVGVSISIDDAVTRVQALLSRTQTDVYMEGDPPGGAVDGNPDATRHASRG
jgi:hypothetical protein